MKLAICVRCGEPKRGPFTACRKCGFVPTRENRRDRAKSLVLSMDDRDADGAPRLDETSLMAIGAELRAGKLYAYDEERIAKLVNEQELLEGGPRWSVVLAFALGIAILATVVGVGCLRTLLGR